MANQYDDLYRQLMDSESLFSNPSQYNPGRRYQPDEDEFEDFITSKELDPKLDKREKSLGLVGTSDGIIEEDAYFKRYKTNYEHKYTEKELAQMRSSCIGTIVHDYSEKDIYHMSDEYRREHDMLSEISGKLSAVKGTYRKVDAWIEAMRTVVHAWEILEDKGNFVHTQQEFFEMISAGRIVSNRIILPKLKKMNQYDIDVLIKYISNPELDPKELLPIDTAPQDDWYDSQLIEDTEEYQEYYNEYMASDYIDREDETYKKYYKDYIDDLDKEDLVNMDQCIAEAHSYALSQRYDSEADRYAKDRIEEDTAMRLLSIEETEHILRCKESPGEIMIEVKDIKPKHIKGYDARTVYGSMKRKKKKKAKTKKDRIKQYHIESLHDILNKIQNDPANRGANTGYNTRSYMLTNSMFEPIKPPKSFFDEMRFEGSWADDDAVYLYELALREEALKEHPSRSKYVSFGDQEVQKFFKLLEENGVNTLTLRRKMDMPTDDSVKEAEARATKKENKKMESAIIQRITKLNADPKFKKLVAKAENALNKQFADY